MTHLIRKTIFIFIFLNNFLQNEATLQALVPSEDYTHALEIDEDNPQQYLLLWKMINSSEIQFEVHCKTKGWLGFGISSTGGMGGADIVIGWVKNGEAVLKVKISFNIKYLVF